MDVHDQIAPQPIGATEQTAEGTDSIPFDINRDDGYERVQKRGCPRSNSTAAGQYDNGPLREQLLTLQCLQSPESIPPTVGDIRNAQNHGTTNSPTLSSNEDEDQQNSMQFKCRYQL